MNITSMIDSGSPAPWAWSQCEPHEGTGFVVTDHDDDVVVKLSGFYAKEMAQLITTTANRVAGIGSVIH